VQPPPLAGAGAAPDHDQAQLGQGRLIWQVSERALAVRARRGPAREGASGGLGAEEKGALTTTRLSLSSRGGSYGISRGRGMPCSGDGAAPVAGLPLGCPPEAPGARSRSGQGKKGAPRPSRPPAGLRRASRHRLASDTAPARPGWAGGGRVIPRRWAGLGRCGRPPPLMASSIACRLEISGWSRDQCDAGHPSGWQRQYRRPDHGR
jgi:hypothetical protein